MSLALTGLPGIRKTRFLWSSETQSAVGVHVRKLSAVLFPSVDAWGRFDSTLDVCQLEFITRTCQLALITQAALFCPSTPSGRFMLADVTTRAALPRLG